MKLLGRKKVWRTDEKGCYSQSSLVVLGRAFPRLLRTRVRFHFEGADAVWNRELILFGVVVRRSKLFQKSDSRRVLNLIKVGYDPMSLPKAQGLLRLMQRSSLQLLKKVAAVCREHGILWWLEYGTLLGAVRHGGFIPWDDDIDIGMLRDDFERFRAVCGQAFAGDEFSINYMEPLQIRLRGLPVQVDIFAFDRAAESWPAEEEEKTRETIRRRYACAARLEFEGHGLPVSNYSYEGLRAMDRDLMWEGRAAAADGSLYPAIEAVAPYVAVRPDAWMFPLGKMAFEGELFPVPAKPELSLFSYYGDWGRLPDNPQYHFRVESLTPGQVERLIWCSSHSL